jgi:SOS response associated peptidase (SRAP)
MRARDTLYSCAVAITEDRINSVSAMLSTSAIYPPALSFPRITTWPRPRSSLSSGTTRKTGERELALMRWGFVPFFTKQLSDVKGISTINARSEGIEHGAHPFRNADASCPQMAITNAGHSSSEGL